MRISYALTLGKYYLYDGMIFPEVKSESWRKTATDAFKRIGSTLSQVYQFFRRQPEKTERDEVKDSDIEKLSKPLPHEDAQAKCLDFFSSTHQQKLKKLDHSKFVMVVNNFSLIYDQLNRQRLCMGNARSDNERIARYLPKVCMLYVHTEHRQRRRGKDDCTLNS